MKTDGRVCSRVPGAELARAGPGEIEAVRFDQLVGHRQALVLGVPGAFTPVCTNEHVPTFVANAKALRDSGYELLICVAPNDPFTLDAWRRQVDPNGTLTFLSDGNRSLARALGVDAQHPDYFLGHSVRRYVMTCAGGRITHIAVEPSLTLLTCTRPEDLPAAQPARQPDSAPAARR